MPRGRKGLTKSSVFKIVKKVTQQQAERKDHVNADSSLEVSNAGLTLGVKCLSLVGVGNAAYEREGLKITPTYLQFRYRVAGADSFNYLRVILIQYLEDDAVAAPTLIDVLQNTTPNGFLQPYRRSAGNRVRLLYDKTHNMISGTNNYHQVRFVRMPLQKKLKIKQLIYNAGTSTAATGNIYLLAISDSQVSTHPTISYVSKMSYRDY